MSWFEIRQVAKDNFRDPDKVFEWASDGDIMHRFDLINLANRAGYLHVHNRHVNAFIAACPVPRVVPPFGDWLERYRPEA